MLSNRLSEAVLGDLLKNRDVKVTILHTFFTLEMVV